MIYKIDYSKDAIKVIKKWKKSNKPLFDKLRKVLNSVTTQHPYRKLLVNKA